MGGNPALIRINDATKGVEKEPLSGTQGTHSNLKGGHSVWGGGKRRGVVEKYGAEGTWVESCRGCQAGGSKGETCQ